MKRSVCAIGHFCRNSSQIGNGFSTQRGIEMIEIGAPIGDGRAAAHEAALSVFAGSLARNTLDFIAGSDGTANAAVDASFLAHSRSTNF